MATLKKLFCLVDGETASRAFPIKVAHDDTVGDLKDLIKIKKAPEFDDIVADSLTLWRVSIPIVGDDKDEEFPLQLNDSLPADKNKLSPATLLLKVFPDGLPEETVHIIVQRPQQALKRGLQDAGE
ncbi:hypothetical protein EDD11_005444 [Mortierella claussenii]|nr:hypothetical protein EDD11_005444 [Mortierella claussenii]